MKAVEQAQRAHAVLQEQLADPDLYTRCSAQEIADLVQQEAHAQQHLAQVEQVWMEAAHTLEAQKEHSALT
jgi:hypothetical protein